MKKKSIATSKDVAERAGVSHATASRAFSCPDKVKEETRLKILEAARDLNYIPSSVAATLKARKSNTVGFVISNIRNPFFTDVAYQLQNSIKKNGMHLLIGLSDEDAREELDLLTEQISHRANCILFTPSAFCRETEELIAGSKRVHFIQLFRKCYENVSSLTVNDRAGARMATERLLACGHRKILLLDGFSHLPTYRREGYLDAYERGGVPADERYIMTLPLSERVCDTIAGALDELAPTAVICVSEILTSQTVEAIRKNKMKIYRDISVISYDDCYTAKALSITAVGHCKEKIIDGIKRMLDSVIAEEDELLHEIAEPVLIERESVRPI